MDNWNAFIPNGTAIKNGNQTIYKHMAWIFRNLTAKANRITSFTLMFSWYFPYRTYAGHDTNYFNESNEVTNYVLNNIGINTLMASLVEFC